MKVLPLKGTKSLTALRAFSALLLGYKMLPAHIGEDYETFYAAFNDKTEAEKEKVLRLAAAFVSLGDDEVAALVSFVCDKNGVPYSASNIGNLSAGELHEIIVAVCMEIGRIKIELVGEDEKKNCPDSQ